MAIQKVLYAGSFDLLTNGHLWMINTCIKSFERVIVAIGDNPNKKPLFTPRERMDTIVECVQSTDFTYGSFEGLLLIDYARSVNADAIIRGIRNPEDARFEQAMCDANRDDDASITTIFLMPPRELAGISSSFVKGYLGFKGWEDRVRRYVPAPVLRRLKEKYSHD